MAALYVTWLADAARLTGYPVIEVAGWRGRGHGGMRLVEGVVGHHTADGPNGDYPSLNIVRDGRAGLAGPLSNLGLARSGAVYVIAAGQGWHAGASRWAGYNDLNDEYLGIEAESVGTRDDWTAAQRDCYPRLVAALLYYMRRGADRFCGHKECALPAGRKIDPAYWDLPGFRTRVAWLLADPLGRIPRFAQPATAQPGGIETMAFNDGFKDWAGNQQTVLSWMNNIDRRVAQLAGDEPKSSAKREDLGYARDQIRTDAAGLDATLARITSTLATVAGDVAALKAYVEGTADQS